MNDCPLPYILYVKMHLFFFFFLAKWPAGAKIGGKTITFKIALAPEAGNVYVLIDIIILVYDQEAV